MGGIFSGPKEDDATRRLRLQVQADTEKARLQRQRRGEQNRYAQVTGQRGANILRTAGLEGGGQLKNRLG
ncbi:MAG: hypothetical protein ACKVIF_01275 [Rhodospirillales bacterium]